MAPTRRSLLRALGATVPLAVAGCRAADRTGTTTGPTPSRAPATEPEPESPAGSETTALPARRALPEAGGGWDLVEADRISATNLGGRAGFVGEYESPEGTRFRAVAIEMRESSDPRGKAERWACIGWDVAVAYEDFAFAAGTGTEQAVYTPETPPHMDRTAIPGSAPRSRELLARSPLLSAERVDANEVDCES